MKVYINGQGHVTKMATMAINSKKIFFSRTRRPMILKLGMKHQGEELYKVYINHDLWDDLDLSYGKANIGCPCIRMGKVSKMLVKCAFEGH